MNALETKITITESSLSEYSRISDLSQRANRCTNGKRYTVSELKNQIDKEGYILKSVYVSDKFGDLGLVGVIGIQETQTQFVIDLFCLSCRALGRNIEEQMLSTIVNSFNITDFNWITTGKNNEFLELINRYIKNV